MTWGMGLLSWDLKNSGTSVNGKQTNGLFDIGAGFEWFIMEKADLDFSIHYEQLLFQDLDMAGYGDKNTGIIEARLGVNLYFGGKKPMPAPVIEAPKKIEPVVIPEKKPEPIIIPEKKAEPIIEPPKKPEPIIIFKKEAPIVLEGVTFKTGSAILAPEAKSVLDKVHQTLVDYPEMTLEVRGYTDNVGNRLKNVGLSKKRAEAVKVYLVGKGIAASRIQTMGFGPDNPIAPNTTPAGRLKNRRIEFIRLD